MNVEVVENTLADERFSRGLTIRPRAIGARPPVGKRSTRLSLRRRGHRVSCPSKIVVERGLSFRRPIETVLFDSPGRPAARANHVGTVAVVPSDALAVRVDLSRFSVPHKASSASCFCGLSSVSKRLY